MENPLRAMKRDWARTRADRIWLAALAAMVALFVILAVFGLPFGVWGVLFPAGALVPATVFAATERSGKWRKPVAVASLLIFPAWVVLGALALRYPVLWPYAGLSSGYEPGVEAVVRGAVTIGTIMGLIRLLRPEGRPEGRPEDRPERERGRAR